MFVIYNGRGLSWPHLDTFAYTVGNVHGASKLMSWYSPPNASLWIVPEPFPWLHVEER